jgi:hypothetical protein
MNPVIQQMVDNIIGDNNAAAQEDFESAISMKLNDQIEQRKQEIARQLGAHNADVQAAS